MQVTREQALVLVRRLIAQTASGRLRWDAGADGVFAAKLPTAVVVVSEKHGLVIRNSAGGVTVHEQDGPEVRELRREAMSALRSSGEFVDALINELDAAARASDPHHAGGSTWPASRHGPERD